MSASDGARRALPEHPSSEHLRKQAKRLAKKRGVRLAAAQRHLAGDYGFADWAALMAHVRRLEPAASLSALAEAARRGDAALVEQLIASGHDPNEGGTGTSPLWETCMSKAPRRVRLAIAETLIKAGASARRAVPGQRPLHAVAARGPVELAELLIRHGAIEWEPNAKGRSALDIARRSRAKDKAALVELFDRPVIRDRSFRAAVDAIHAGAVEELERLLNANPRLMIERICEPACYRDSGRSQYFLDPKLFWFIANNPTLIEAMPANIADVARAMIARGVEKADLDYTLGLAMTSSKAREQGHQIPLVKLLIEAGARPSPDDLSGVLGHGETGIVEYLLSAGLTMTAPIAAALGRTDALAAGASPNRNSSQHSHSQPLHQAALHDNVELLELLIAHGARLDAVDELWGATPLGWATYAGAGSASVIAYLRERMNG